MKNLYPSNVSLTAQLLSEQEVRRDNTLSGLLRAVIAKPGVASGYDVSANESGVRVEPGVAVWPDAGGIWRVVETPATQSLSLPGEGEWLVMLHADAEVLTQPRPLPDSVETAYLVSERLAYAVGGNSTDTRLERLGLTVEPSNSSSRGLVLASVRVSAGRMTCVANPPRLQAHAPTMPSQEEVVGTVLAALPPTPTLEEIEDAVLERLPTAPSEETLVRAVFAALPPTPTLEEMKDAVLESLPKPEVPPQARAYSISERKALSAALPAPVLSRFTLPAALPEHSIAQFSGRGMVVEVDGTRALLRPEIEETLEPLYPWAFSDPALIVGDALGINGPNAGFYVSTLSPVRNSETKSQDKTVTGLLRWQHVLQRYTPDTPIPVTVVDSQQVEAPADALPIPFSLTTLNEALMWGPRPQPFPVHQDSAGNPQANVISPVVNGRKLKAVNIAGVTATRLTLILEGTLLVTPLSEAPTPVREGAGL